MDDVINKINYQLGANRIILKDLKDQEQDMKCYLDKKAILWYENCVDIKLNIDSIINKIIFKKCKNINLSIHGLVNGIEIDNCNNIHIECNKVKPVNAIIVDKSSNVSIILSKKYIDETYYQIESSKDIKVMDKRNKIHFSK